MITPDDDAFQTAAGTLNRLVTIAAEGDTDQHRDTAMLNHAAATNRTLRAAHDRYLQALRHILATTASPQVRRTATDALTSP